MSAGLPATRVNVRSLAKEGERFKLDANGEILDALADLTPVTEVLSFQADISVKPWRLSGARVTGSIRAQIAQECVVTLKPMETSLAFDIERSFLPEHDPELKPGDIVDGEIIIDIESEDLPDPIEGNTIPIWEVLVEELNLQIDPFPRSDEAELNEKTEEFAVSDDEVRKPFADLKAMMDKKSAQPE